MTWPRPPTPGARTFLSAASSKHSTILVLSRAAYRSDAAADRNVRAPALLVVSSCVRCTLAVFFIHLLLATPTLSAQTVNPHADLVGWFTNGPAVYSLNSPSSVVLLTKEDQPLVATKLQREGGLVAPKLQREGGSALNQPGSLTNRVFDRFASGSLNNLVWTNFIAHTNGRTTHVWEPRRHPPGWPAHPPIAGWDTNCLMWAWTGLTALSPCWEAEGNSGQVPVTALTKRHAYTRGHGMSDEEGVTTNFTGRKVWFVAANQTLVERTVLKAIVRTFPRGGKRDYTILLFNQDLPDSIEPMRVVSAENLSVKYPVCAGAPRPLFKTEQGNGISAEVPGFSVNTWKGGDSGSPDMLPMPGELVFFGGRSTSGPSPEMQSDMDALCTLAGLDPHKYQLQWLDLSQYPSY